MKNKIKFKHKILACLIIFIFTFVLLYVVSYMVGLGHTKSHEFIHKKIFNRYDLSSKTTIDYLTLSGVTEIMPNQNYSKCNDFCKLANAENDIIGYNISVFINFICIFSVAVVLIKIIISQLSSCNLI